MNQWVELKNWMGSKTKNNCAICVMLIFTSYFSPSIILLARRCWICLQVAHLQKKRMHPEKNVLWVKFKNWGRFFHQKKNAATSSLISINKIQLRRFPAEKFSPIIWTEFCREINFSWKLSFNKSCCQLWVWDFLSLSFYFSFSYSPRIRCSFRFLESPLSINLVFHIPLSTCIVFPH